MRTAIAFGGIARLSAAWLRLSANTRGVIWITLAGFLFISADVIAKSLGRSMDAIQIAFLRYAAAMIFILPLIAHLGFASVRTQRPMVHIGRTVLAATGQVFGYYAVINMLLADVTAINFSRPLFVTMLAVVFLSERVGVKRWGATIVGFCGVLVMVRPSPAGLDPAALAAIASAALFAGSIIITRRYSTTETPLQFVFYYHAVGAVLFIVPVCFVWTTPSLDQVPLILLLAALGTVAQTCGVRGFSIGEASVLGPVEYTRIIFATALGFVFFAELPGLYTWLGVSLIIASVIYVTRRPRARG